MKAKVPVQASIHSQLLYHNGFMDAVNNRPFHLAGLDLLVLYNFCAALDQIAGVNLCVKDSCHSSCIPVPIAHQVFMGNNALGVLVVVGWKIPCIIQTYSNGVQPSPLRGPCIKYLRELNQQIDRAALFTGFDAAM